MKVRLRMALAVAVSIAVAAGVGEARPRRSIRAQWKMPPKCTPFAPPRIPDLKEELRLTGYRLVMGMHPKHPDEAKGETDSKDLYIVNADGTGLKQFTNTPDKDERGPRTSPDGKHFLYNWGNHIVDVATMKTRSGGGCDSIWTPDGKMTVGFWKKKGGGREIVYCDVRTGRATKRYPVGNDLIKWPTDISFDGSWLISEIRNYQGHKYNVVFMPSKGGELRKMPNYPGKVMGECHPTFSPDGKWMCWNAGGGLAIRRFDPSLSDGTDGKIHTPPDNAKVMGQDPCGRWSHCGRYIAYVNIPSSGSWRVHSPLHILRVADGKAIKITPPGWVTHHWDYDWLPPAAGK